MRERGRAAASSDGARPQEQSCAGAWESGGDWRRRRHGGGTRESGGDGDGREEANKSIE